METPGMGEGRGDGQRGARQKGGTEWREASHQGQGQGKRGKMGHRGGTGGEETDGGVEFGVRQQGREGGRGSRHRRAGGGAESPKRRRRRWRREARPSRERGREKES